MSLYPSLEDMAVDKMAKAQTQAASHQQQQPQPAITDAGAPVSGVMQGSSLYPSLNDFMGLDLSTAVVEAQSQQVAIPQQAGPVTSYSSGSMAAPVSGQQNLAILRSEIKQGIREVVACKGQDGKIGLRVQAVSKGVFVSFVMNSSPAAMAGLRFGDQILQIDGVTIAGYSRDKVMSILKKSSSQKISFAVRDRPFERAITLQKDSSNHVGFVFKNGKIKQIVKDSSAARNGLLIDHNLLEVNGQNVIGLKDKEISEVLSQSPRTVTVTIMPSFVYDHMVKCMSDSLVKKSMDHSIPDI